MKKVIWAILILLILFISYVLYNTLTLGKVSYDSDQEVVEVRADARLLSEAIQFETISHKPEMINDSAFESFHTFLFKEFPLLNSHLKKEIINKYSLMYKWVGSKSSLKPIVLMAHMDVVPVERASLNDWEEPPFSGNISDDFIYGRGALDDKGSLIAMLLAIENLLADGFSPERTIIVCLGHDEEIGGKSGAMKMAGILEDRGVEAYMVLDEGGTLSEGLVPGVKEKVALIGTGDKGYASLQLTVSLPGGHSSMPEQETALEVLNSAIYNLNKNPMPNRLTPPLEGFVNSVGPHLPFIQKMAFANPALFKPLIFSEYEKSAGGAALIHTTQVTTIFNSGVKENVVPNRARAVVNYRLLPGDEPEEILDRALTIVDDENVKIQLLSGHSTSTPISDYKSDAFRDLGEVITTVYPGCVISPYLVLGQTDSRHFYPVSDNVFRFSPIPMGPEDLSRIHGSNERISLSAFQNSANFYATLLKYMGNP